MTFRHLNYSVSTAIVTILDQQSSWWWVCASPSNYGEKHNEPKKKDNNKNDARASERQGNLPESPIKRSLIRRS